jgi:hypothetical protein
LWIQAYEEKVRDVTGFRWYKTKATARKAFEKVASQFPDTNPYTFMAAVFPPNQDWWIPKKGGPNRGWKKLQYPFPNMLYGEKAKTAYIRYTRRKKKSRQSFQSEVLRDIDISLKQLDKLDVDLDNLSELFWLASDSTISPFLFVSLPEAEGWTILQKAAGNLPEDVVDNVMEYKNKLKGYPEVVYEISQKIGAYERS